MEGIFVNNIIIKSFFKEYSVQFSSVNDYDFFDESDKRLHLIIDSNVYSLYKDEYKIDKKFKSIIKIDAIEKNKQFETVGQVAETLLERGIVKNDRIIVIGGGIVQDIGAFVSNILKRGIEWIFIPTTLLAMCDSCVGSKVGINMKGFKNQVGIFWPPSKIIIDLNFLKTLNEIDIYSGIGEIIKVHIISALEDYENLEGNYDKMTNTSDLMEKFIARSLEIKKGIVETDEFDKDYRHILNYGHTFGHAIEAYTNNQIPHGIGVTIGMDIANFISYKMGILNENEFQRLHRFISRNIKVEQFTIEDTQRFVNILKADKKFDGQHLSVILNSGIGSIIKKKVIINELFIDFIGKYSKNIFMRDL